jgi:hypothetical protein
MKYFGNEIPIEKVEAALKVALSREDVPDNYVRNLINCESINESCGNISMDKIIFIYKYGSNHCKRIAVDEKLNMV